MIKRRSFLLIAALALVSTWRLYVLDGSGRHETQGLPIAFQNFFGDIGSAIFIGKKYLRAIPEEQSVIILIKRILATVPEERGTLLATVLPHQPELVTRRYRLDFIKEWIMHVEGWALSATGAHYLYVLYIPT
jgi:hypothetical protein